MNIKLGGTNKWMNKKQITAVFDLKYNTSDIVC